MTNKTNYIQTEIGEIPEEWKVFPLSQIVNIISGGTPKTSESEYWNGDIPWLSIVDFNRGNRFVYETEKTITEDGLRNSSTQILKRGQVVISARGTVGAISQVGKDMTFNQSCYGLDAKELLSNDFLYYLLKHQINSIKQKTHGSVFNTITRETFDNITVALPLLKHEQDEIVNILSSLDDKIELNRKMNKTLEEIGKALFKRWFVDFEFPNEDGKPYKSSGGEVVDSKLGEIPEDWEIKPLDEVATFLNGIACQKYPPIDEFGLPVIKIAELHNGISESSDRASSSIASEYIVEDGDVLFSWSGSLEIVLWTGGRGILNQHLYKVSSKNNPKWFYYLWILKHLSFFREIASNKATTMGHIQRRHLTESLVLVPNQTTLVNMDSIMTPLLNKIIVNCIEINFLTQIRDSLLPRLMSGKLRLN